MLSCARQTVTLETGSWREDLRHAVMLHTEELQPCSWKVVVHHQEKPRGWWRACFEWTLEAQSGSSSNVFTHMHTQPEVGSIPAVSESWANQIINLQGLNYIARVHTYCHIRDSATGAHTHTLTHIYTRTHTPGIQRQPTSNNWTWTLDR